MSSARGTFTSGPVYKPSEAELAREYRGPAWPGRYQPRDEPAKTLVVNHRPAEARPAVAEVSPSTGKAARANGVAQAAAAPRPVCPEGPLNVRPIVHVRQSDRVIQVLRDAAAPCSAAQIGHAAKVKPAYVAHFLAWRIAQGQIEVTDCPVKRGRKLYRWIPGANELPVVLRADATRARKVLTALWKSGRPLGASDIGRLVGMKSLEVSAALARFVRKGDIVSSRDPQDGRRVLYQFAPPRPVGGGQ